MSLKEELAPLIGNRKKFILLRICDVDAETARKLTGTRKTTYNSWLRDDKFVSIYRRRDEFAAEYKPEAIKMLRRDNQLAAVMLEEKIIQRMKEEVDSGEYRLLRTNIAREVYARLLASLDEVPQVQSLTWAQRIEQIFTDQPQQIVEGNYHEVTEATDSEQTEHQESPALQESQQISTEVQKETSD